MRIDRIVRLLAAGALLAGAAVAQSVQNMDIVLLLGPVTGTAEVITGADIKTGAGFSFGLQYGYQLHAMKIGDLYFELPIAWTFRGNTSVSGQNGVTAVSNESYFFTPGVRFKVHLDQRVSVYAAGGIGYGSFQEYVAAVTSGTAQVVSHQAGHLVGDCGGGLDFRLTKLLSLRFDARDYVSARGLGGTSGRNHGVYGFGLAFHF